MLKFFTHRKGSRILAVLMFIFVTCVTLNLFARLIAPLLRIHYDWRFELAIVLGQLLFQLPFIYKFAPEIKLEYYYNMLLLSFAGSLLLWPLLIVNAFVPLAQWLNVFCFFGIVIFMFLEHKRRVYHLSLPTFISYTWALYRFLVLLVII
jgi:hypothetical protein